MSITEYGQNFNVFTTDGQFKKRIGHTLTAEEIKEQEDYLDQDDLEMQFEYENKQIKTMKDLRNLVRMFKSTKEIEKIEDLIEDEDYYYIFNWYLINYTFKKL